MRKRWKVEHYSATDLLWMDHERLKPFRTTYHWWQWTANIQMWGSHYCGFIPVITRHHA
jgi:hypothetical protein